MKIKGLLIGTITASLFAGGYLAGLFPTNTKQYSPRPSAVKAQYAKDAAEYWHMLKADHVTGEVDLNLVRKAREEVLQLAKYNNKAALGLNWKFAGPDNVGGRTRGFLIDKNNSNILYAGGVSGGLFRSTDAGATWTPLIDLGDNLAISCITQTNSGRIFFGTGCSFENADGQLGSGAIGAGVYEYIPSSGTAVPILTTTTIPNNTSSDPLAEINDIVAYGERLFVATRSGLKIADPDGSGNYPSTISGWTTPTPSPTGSLNSNCHDIDLHASSGTVIVATSANVFVSNDGGNSFNRAVDPNNSNLSVFAGNTYLRVAIAPSDKNYMYAAGTAGSGCLKDIWQSVDGGVTWTSIATGGGSFDPFSNPGVNCQGWYDMAIDVNPSDKGEILVGGVQLYKWNMSSPGVGQWTLAAVTAPDSPANPFYVHADKHNIVWPSSNLIYVCTDGGIAKSLDGGATWSQNNRDYNVTQFYSLAISAGDGYVMGGAQDNGTQFVIGSMSGSPKGAIEVSGGDGFDCAISNIAGAYFATVYNGALTRASQSNFNPSTIWDAELSALCDANGDGSGTCGPFFTKVTLWETLNDPNTVDSVWVYNKDTAAYPAGTVIEYPSASTTDGYPYPIGYFQHTLTAPLNVGDSIKLPDYVQSKMVFYAGSNKIYMTRDAIKFDKAAEWDLIASSASTPDAFSGTPNVMRFSNDGNYLFVGTTSGSVYRFSNLSQAKDSMNTDVRTGNSVITCERIGTGFGVVTGIAIDPNDPDFIIVTTGSYTSGNHVYRCKNATTVPSASGTGNFTAIQGPASSGLDGYLPKMPVYDALITYSDRDIVLIGTEWGVWASQNAYSASSGSLVKWYDESTNGMAHVPVFRIAQQTLNYIYSQNPEKIYLGTHGRGFYETADLVGVQEIQSNKDEFKTNLKVYPNPLSDVGYLTFELPESANATINIYDINGAVVKSINLGKQLKGSKKVSFNVNDLSIGTYIISLDAGKYKDVTKFVVVK